MDIDPELTVADTIADDQSFGPEGLYEGAEIESYLAGWVAKLGDKQRLVIERRYGLDGVEASTLEGLANELGVTRERVRQIQIEALTRLRQRIACEGVMQADLL